MADKDRCASCGQVFSIDYLYHRDGGWVRHRSEGGTHALRLRKADYSVRLCHGCMEEFVCKDSAGRPIPNYAVDGFGLAEVPQ